MIRPSARSLYPGDRVFAVVDGVVDVVVDFLLFLLLFGFAVVVVA